VHRFFDHLERHLAMRSAAERAPPEVATALAAVARVRATRKVHALFRDRRGGPAQAGRPTFPNPFR